MTCPLGGCSESVAKSACHTVTVAYYIIIIIIVTVPLAMAHIYRPVTASFRLHVSVSCGWEGDHAGDYDSGVRHAVCVPACACGGGPCMGHALGIKPTRTFGLGRATWSRPAVYRCALGLRVGHDTEINLLMGTPCSIWMLPRHACVACVGDKPPYGQAMQSMRAHLACVWDMQRGSTP